MWYIKVNGEYVVTAGGNWYTTKNKREASGYELERSAQFFMELYRIPGTIVFEK